MRLQILGRQGLDPVHSDVIVEVAHEHLRQQQGELAYLAWYVPLSLSIATDHRGWVRVGLLLLGMGIVIGGTAVAVADRRRLTRFLDRAGG